VIGIDPRGSRELAAVLLALKQTEREVVKRINVQSRQVINPVWNSSVLSNSKTVAETRILGNTAKSLVSGTGVKLRAGVGAKPLSGGLSSEDNRAIEFGANRNATTTYRTRSRKGKGYSVTRHTQRQLRWKRKAGPTYSAAATVIPRVAALWTATAVRVLHEAFEAGRK
jgi:hypothetical protein